MVKERRQRERERRQKIRGNKIAKRQHKEKKTKGAIMRRHEEGDITKRSYNNKKKENEKVKGV